MSRPDGSQAAPPLPVGDEAGPPTAWRRHQLVWPNARGWATIRPGRPDPLTSDCLAHWARADLPLVVIRQTSAEDGSIAVGLPAPTRWQRRRIALRLDAEGIGRVGSFPRAASIDGLLAPAVRPAWRTLVGRIDRLAAAPTRVHGSHGWEALTGQPYRHDDSDLDLLLPADDDATADAICEALAGADFAGPRLDGELLIGEMGIAWREWHRSRRATGERVLAKRLHGVALVAAGTAIR